MDKKEVTTCRVDDYASPANCIPDPHKIVQHDVINALGALQDERHAMHMGTPMNWERLDAAHSTMHRAHHHQPGEAGASTWKPGSTRPGTIVRR